MEPAVHREPGDGGCDQEGDEDQSEKVCRKQTCDAGYACAEDFSYADLPCTLRRAVGGEAEQAEAGDKDGERGEIDKEPAESDFRYIMAVEIFVQEAILEWPVGNGPGPFVPNGGDRRG